MSTNIALPFSQSIDGKPIIITTTASPGTLIHKSGTALDFVWLWFSLNDYANYLSPVYLTIIKGVAGNYVMDGATYKIKAGSKQEVEIGIPISSLCEIRAFINTEHSSVIDIPVAASGYIHRRID